MPTDSAKKHLSAWERRKLYSNQLREQHASIRYSSATTGQSQSNRGDNRTKAPPRPRGRPSKKPATQVKNGNGSSSGSTGVQLSLMTSVENKLGSTESHKHARVSPKKMPKRILHEQGLKPSQGHTKETGKSGPSTSTTVQPKVARAALINISTVKKVVLKSSLVQNLTSTQNAKKQAEREPKAPRRKKLRTEEVSKFAPAKNIAAARKGDPYVQLIKIENGHGRSEKQSLVRSTQATGPNQKGRAVISMRPMKQCPSEQTAPRHSVKRNLRRSTLVTNPEKRRSVRRPLSNALCIAKPKDKLSPKTQSEVSPAGDLSPSCSSTTTAMPVIEGFQSISSKSYELSERAVSVSPKQGAPGVKDTSGMKTPKLSSAHVVTPDNSFCNTTAGRTPFLKTDEKVEPVTSTRSTVRTRKRYLPSSSSASTPPRFACEVKLARCHDPYIQTSAGGTPFKRTPSSEESGDSFKTAADNTADMQDYSSIENDSSNEDLNDTFTLEEPRQLGTPELTPKKQRGLPAPSSCLKKERAISAAKKSVSFSVPSMRDNTPKRLPKTPRRSRTIKESLDAWLAARGITLSRHSCCFQEDRSTPHRSSSTHKRCGRVPEESFREESSLNLDISSSEYVPANNVPKKASLPDILSELQDCLNKEVPASDVEQWLCQLEDNVPNIKDYSGFWICRCLIHESAGNHTQALECLTKGLHSVKSVCPISVSLCFAHPMLPRVKGAFLYFA